MSDPRATLALARRAEATVKPFFLYMLRCGDGSLYVGHTDDLDRRIREHSEGLCAHTKNHRPLELIFVEEFPTREEAFSRERQVKGWTRAKKEALIRGNWKRLKGLSISVSAPWESK